MHLGYVCIHPISCTFFYQPVPYNIIPYQINNTMPHHTLIHHIIPHHTISHNISHHATPYHTIPYQTTQDHKIYHTLQVPQLTQWSDSVPEDRNCFVLWIGAECLLTFRSNHFRYEIHHVTSAKRKQQERFCPVKSRARTRRIKASEWRSGSDWPMILS